MMLGGTSRAFIKWGIVKTHPRAAAWGVMLNCGDHCKRDGGGGHSCLLRMVSRRRCCLSEPFESARRGSNAPRLANSKQTGMSARPIHHKDELHRPRVYSSWQFRSACFEVSVGFYRLDAKPTPNPDIHEILPLADGTVRCYDEGVANFVPYSEHFNPG